MVLVSTQIEIACPPARVREIFFDFAKYPEWRTGGGITSITPAAADKPNLEAGDKLTVQLGGTTFSPKILENTDLEFRWLGSLPYIFTGAHTFRFEPSETTSGWTTFKNSEQFSGAASWLFNLPLGLYGQTEKGFGAFNENLKKRAEGMR